MNTIEGGPNACLASFPATASDGKLEGKPGNEAKESWKGSLGTRLRKAGREAWERG